jgi:hypothetical protein
MKVSARRLLCTAIALVCVIILASSAMGQCSMCRTALAGSNNALFIRNFNLGVLVLLIPPVTIFCSIFVVLRRHKTSHESPVDIRGSIGSQQSPVSSRESRVSTAPSRELNDGERELSE